VEADVDSQAEDGKAPPSDRPDHGEHHGGPAARYREFRRSLRANAMVDLTWRIGVLTVGVLVVATGIALLALPGPGWATIFIGLMILASEFTWARSSLDWTKARALTARDKAMDPQVRRRNQVVGVVLALVGVLATAWYLQRYGFPGPVGTWLEGVWNT
jgi:uncharacterized protein (TIGR02611 family)